MGLECYIVCKTCREYAWLHKIGYAMILAEELADESEKDWSKLDEQVVDRKRWFGRMLAFMMTHQDHQIAIREEHEMEDLFDFLDPKCGLCEVLAED